MVVTVALAAADAEDLVVIVEAAVVDEEDSAIVEDEVSHSNI